MRYQLSTALHASMAIANLTQTGSELPLQQGIFVEIDTPCVEANNSSILSFWGDRMNSAHFEGRILEVTPVENAFSVVLDLQGNAGMGGHQSHVVTWRISAPTAKRLRIAQVNGAAEYRWCATSMDELASSQVDESDPALEIRPEDAAPFMGTWGYVSDHGVLCEPQDTKTFFATHVETAHSQARFGRDDYTEIAPGHWRVDAKGTHEDEAPDLVLDLHIDGRDMLEIVSTEDGRRSEHRWSRCAD